MFNKYTRKPLKKRKEQRHRQRHANWTDICMLVPKNTAFATKNSQNVSIIQSKYSFYIYRGWNWARHQPHKGITVPVKSQRCKLKYEKENLIFSLNFVTKRSGFRINVIR